MARYENMQERIIANSVPAADSAYNGTPCWIWIGAYGSSGYGTLNVRARTGKVKHRGAHRESLKAFTGRRLTSRSVCKHLCNNPCCVNPDHLVGGSQKSNVRQCVAEGRHYTPFRKAA
ncbi:hypothetical protein [Burkholderia anthina]|uniref:hypothetical protein n=1 Tax=Burkholderia anthina TaxID=179879 RepID=UPI001AA08D70|nr:hypothetical protein [Burkholderia anthina]QTD88911.1 hypothetical protein J4G50_13950 [Burkholderia anthina]